MFALVSWSAVTSHEGVWQASPEKFYVTYWSCFKIATVYRGPLLRHRIFKHICLRCIIFSFQVACSCYVLYCMFPTTRSASWIDAALWAAHEIYPKRVKYVHHTYRLYGRKNCYLAELTALELLQRRRTWWLDLMEFIFTAYMHNHEEARRQELNYLWHINN